MFKKSRLRVFLLSIMAVLLSISMFSATVEAKGSTGTGKNKAPVITEGETIPITINEGNSASITLNATDANRDSLSWSITYSGNNGVVTPPAVSQNVNQITYGYTPNIGYTGTDRFTVTVSDGKGGSDSITVNVTINPVVVPPTTKTINYVALGDSIATGTTYPGNVIPTYVNYFYEYLVANNPDATVTLQNLAKDGSRSNELYDRLGLGDTSLTDQNMINAVSGADIITISIGGNNLMQAAKDESSLGGYNFNQINIPVAEMGVSDFNSQWVPIIQKIKEINSTAPIYVNTIYNPYNTSDAEFHNLVDKYLNGTSDAGVPGINVVISGNMNYGYEVVDVFTAFDVYNNNMGAITYFYPGIFDLWGQLTRNPHPNTSGQKIITGKLEEVYQFN